MGKRIITAFIIMAIALPAIFFGGMFNILLIGAITMVSGFELFELLPSYKRTPKLYFFILLGICFGMQFVSDKYVGTILGLSIITVLALPVFIEKLNSRDSIMSIGIFMLLYSFGSAYFKIYDENALYIWFVLFATYGCDTGAYFGGYFFGKHKLCPRVSPKKTIEGSVCGVLTSWIFSTLFILLAFKDANIWLVLSGGIVVPMVSQIGDLTFSSMKRFYKIKDFSNIFPGHGGFMDRIDSVVFSLIVFSALMVVIL